MHLCPILKAEKIVGLHSEVYLNDSGNLPNTKGSFVRTVSPPSGKKRTKNYYFFMILELNHNFT